MATARNRRGKGCFQHPSFRPQSDSAAPRSIGVLELQAEGWCLLTPPRRLLSSGMRGRVATILVGFASAALLASCGGDDAPIEPVTTDATGSSSASLSQDEFIASADARCGEANAAIANLTSGTEGGSAAVAQQLAITRGVLSGLQEIGTPDDPGGALDRYYAALGDEVDVLEQQETAVSSGDIATYDSLSTELDAARGKAQAAGEEYGFTECGQQGSTIAGGATPAATAAPTAPAPATTTPAPTDPAIPVEPAPTAPAPPTGGTGGGTATPPPSGGTGGSSGGSSGGISPGG